MADIVLPIVTTPLVDGSPVSGDFINQNTYAVTSPSTSLEVINGRLEGVNLDLGVAEIQPEVIRKGAYSRAGMVGQTLNLDYHKLANSPQGPGSPTLIPGAGATFYVPHDGKVLLMWQVSYAADRITGPVEVDTQGLTSLFLSVDGVSALDGGTVSNSFVRQLPPSVSFGTAVQYRIRRENRDRIWSGHFLTDLTRGWHSAGIGVKSGANMTRIRTRNFKWIWFR